MMTFTIETGTYQVNCVKEISLVFTNKNTDDIEIIKVNYIKGFDLYLDDIDCSRLRFTCLYNNIDMQRKFNNKNWIITNVLCNCSMFNIDTGKDEDAIIGIPGKMHIRNLDIHHDVDDVNELSFELEGFIK